MNAGLRGLVYHAGGLGDFVLSLPALLRLAAAYPHLRWSLWSPDPGRVRLLPGWSAAPSLLQRAGHGLWGPRPDPSVVAELEGLQRVVAFATAPPPWLERVGHRGHFVRTFPLAAGEWVPAYQRRQLDRVALAPVCRPLLPAWRRQVCSAQKRRWLLIHAGSGDARKNLPGATWRAAQAALVGATGLRPALLSGPVEQERGAPEATWGGEVLRCSSLDDLLTVLAQTGLVLGNDSGVVHLAGILGLPTVVVFGPTDPRTWRPLGPRVAVVTAADQECAPCCVRPPICCADQICLQQLASTTVVAAARDLLQRAGREPGGAPTPCIDIPGQGRLQRGSPQEVGGATCSSG